MTARCGLGMALPQLRQGADRAPTFHPHQQTVNQKEA